MESQSAMDNKLRVLIVNDTVTYRKIVSTVLAALPDVEVLGTAANGRIALEKVAQTQPDLLLMDLEMPEMDGIEVLRRLNAARSPVGAIVLSALTAQGAQSTLDCLELGVFDFILKPASGSFDENVRRIREELKPRLAAYSRRRDVRAILAGASRRSAPPSARRHARLRRPQLRLRHPANPKSWLSASRPAAPRHWARCCLAFPPVCPLPC